VKAYKHDPEVNLIIRQTNPNELKNAADKEKYQQLVKKTAVGLFKLY